MKKEKIKIEIQCDERFPVYYIRCKGKKLAEEKRLGKIDKYFEVDKKIVERWEKIIKEYEKVQSEMKEVVGKDFC